MSTRAIRVLRDLWCFYTPQDLLAYYRVRWRPKPDGIPVAIRIRNLRGLRQWCRPHTTDSVVLLDTFAHGYHLPHGKLREDAVILDLGSNAGYTMSDFAWRYPRSRVVGVELDRGNAELARSNTIHFGDRCSVLHGAVWHSNGTITYAGKEEWGFHVMENDDTASSSDSKTASAFTVEAILRQFNIDQVDYMKMDIEGAESLVLTASAGWLRRVREIKVEVHSPATVEGCIRTLSEVGFRCERDLSHWACVYGRRD